jgi:hypothetical protein
MGREPHSPSSPPPPLPVSSTSQSSTFAFKRFPSFKIALVSTYREKNPVESEQKNAHFACNLCVVASECMRNVFLILLPKFAEKAKSADVAKIASSWGATI